MADSRILATAVQLLDTPIARRILEDDRVMKILVGAIGARGKIRRATAAQTARIARSLRLATRDDLRELRRTLERLEEAVGRLEGRPGADS